MIRLLPGSVHPVDRPIGSQCEAAAVLVILEGFLVLPDALVLPEHFLGRYLTCHAGSPRNTSLPTLARGLRLRLLLLLARRDGLRDHVLVNEVRLLSSHRVGKRLHAVVAQQAAADDGLEPLVRLGRHQA